MEFKTLPELVTEVLVELALVPGLSVQTYTEPHIRNNIVTSFSHLFKKRYWQHLTEITYHNLDGVTGVITTNLVGVADVFDIQWIRLDPYKEVDDIRYDKEGINYIDDTTLRYTNLTYSHAQYKTRLIKIVPPTTIGTIAIRARRFPTDLSTETVDIPFDHIALKHLVAANILAADGTNPNQEQNQRLLFEDRYETLVSNEADKPIYSKKSRFTSEFTVG